MIIKEISTQNKGLYLIRDLKEDYKKEYIQKQYTTYKEFVNSVMDNLNTNKKAKLLDYEIIEQ